MELKAILAKVAKNETLTDEEREYLQSYDPKKVADDAVAAYRRKADDKLKAVQDEVELLKAKIAEKDDALKGAEDKSSLALKTLTKQVTDMQKKLEAADAERARFARNESISGIRKKAGISFVQGIDEALAAEAFAKTFAGLKDEDLADDAVCAPLVEAFKKANPALIADKSGHGAGTPPAGGQAHRGPNPFSKATFNLTKQAEIMKNNPDEARRLAAAAGVTIE